MSGPIEIDGASGEGGGQVLRTALTLSMITGRPFVLANVRAGRKRPGVLRQHLAAIRAAQAVSGATVRGDTLGSARVAFSPGRVTGGTHHFNIGSAGSTTLVLQTVLPALALADAPSAITVEGGTHNPMAPPACFLTRVYLPLLARMGAVCTLDVPRVGFYPAGGGRIEARIQPAARLQPLELIERGEVRAVRIGAAVVGIPGDVARRELQTIRAHLGRPAEDCRIERFPREQGPGNVAWVEIESDALTEQVTGIGERGKSAERVGEEVAQEAAAYLAANVPVGEHLADQLLLLLAIAGGGRFRTLPASGHTRTQADLIPRFLDVPITLEATADSACEARVG